MGGMGGNGSPFAAVPPIAAGVAVSYVSIPHDPERETALT